MTDLFPQEPPTTAYSPAFEQCWRVHKVGNKKAAYKAGEKARWTDANWVWLERYLTKRWKEDAKWLEGKYVPHLSSIINQERWTDVYPRKKDPGSGLKVAVVEETHEEAMRKIAIAQAGYKQ